MNRQSINKYCLQRSSDTPMYRWIKLIWLGCPGFLRSVMPACSGSGPPSYYCSPRTRTPCSPRHPPHASFSE